MAGASQGVISDRIARMGGDAWQLKGNGGLQASAADMRRFYHALLKQPAAVREPMLTPHAPATPTAMEGYGLFFNLDAAGKPYRMGHNGSDGVFFAYFVMMPSRRAFLYFVGANGESEVRPLLQATLRTFLAGLDLLPARATPSP
jgi:CubicO group peptidase (beta-lactamase class C family)